jgi:hypothetical protein
MDQTRLEALFNVVDLIKSDLSKGQESRWECSQGWILRDSKPLLDCTVFNISIFPDQKTYLYQISL